MLRFIALDSQNELKKRSFNLYSNRFNPTAFTINYKHKPFVRKKLWQKVIVEKFAFGEIKQTFSFE